MLRRYESEPVYLAAGAAMTRRRPRPTRARAVGRVASTVAVLCVVLVAFASDARSDAATLLRMRLGAGIVKQTVEPSDTAPVYEIGVGQARYWPTDGRRGWWVLSPEVGYRFTPVGSGSEHLVTVTAALGYLHDASALSASLLAGTAVGFADGDGYAALRFGGRVEALRGLLGVDVAYQAGVGEDEFTSRRRELEAVLFVGIGVAWVLLTDVHPGPF